MARFKYVVYLLNVYQWFFIRTIFYIVFDMVIPLHSLVPKEIAIENI